MSATDTDLHVDMNDPDPITPATPDGETDEQKAAREAKEAETARAAEEQRLREENIKLQATLEEARRQAELRTQSSTPAPVQNATPEQIAAAKEKFKNDLLADPAQTILGAIQQVSAVQNEEAQKTSNALLGEQYLENYKNRKMRDDKYAAKVLPEFEKRVARLDPALFAKWPASERAYQLDTFWDAAWGAVARQVATAAPRSPAAPDLGTPGRGGGGDGGSGSRHTGAYSLIEQIGRKAGLSQKDIDDSIKKGRTAGERV